MRNLSPIFESTIQIRAFKTDYIQGETELSFRLIPSLTQFHTKPRTETVREEVVLAKEGISLKDNSVSPCMYKYEINYSEPAISDALNTFKTRKRCLTFLIA